MFYGLPTRNSHMVWQLRYRSLRLSIPHTRTHTRHTHSPISFVEQNEVQKWIAHVTCECSCCCICCFFLARALPFSAAHSSWSANVLVFVSVCRFQWQCGHWWGTKWGKKQKINEIPQRKCSATEETMATRTHWNGETMSWNWSDRKINSIKVAYRILSSLRLHSLLSTCHQRHVTHSSYLRV